MGFRKSGEDGQPGWLSGPPRSEAETEETVIPAVNPMLYLTEEQMGAGEGETGLVEDKPEPQKATGFLDEDLPTDPYSARAAASARRARSGRRG